MSEAQHYDEYDERLVMKLLTLSGPAHVRHMDVARIADATWTLIPRASGKVRAYPYTARRQGNPFARELSLENQERLLDLRDAVYGRRA